MYRLYTIYGHINRLTIENKNNEVVTWKLQLGYPIEDIGTQPGPGWVPIGDCIYLGKLTQKK